MSPAEILVLIGIVSAFAVFGLALAWGNHQTRHLPRMRTEADARAEAGQTQADESPDRVKLAA